MSFVSHLATGELLFLSLDTRPTVLSWQRPRLPEPMLIVRVPNYIPSLLNQFGTKMSPCAIPWQRTHLLNNSRFSRLNYHHSHEARHQYIHPYLCFHILAHKLGWSLPIAVEIRDCQTIYGSVRIFILSVDSILTELR
jgi:hypothetical protein